MSTGIYKHLLAELEAAWGNHQATDRSDYGDVPLLGDFGYSWKCWSRPGGNYLEGSTTYLGGKGQSQGLSIFAAKKRVNGSLRMWGVEMARRALSPIHGQG